MTGLQLRNSILQEAIQGRLVPNVLQPGEKTGAELLLDILAVRQKKENEKKGKKVKKLELSLIEEEPWELPVGWCWCKIKDIIDFSSSGTTKNGAIAPDSWILDLEDIEKDTGRLLQKKRFVDTKALSDKRAFKKENVLYSKLRPYLNKCIIADEDGYCTTEILAFDFGPIYNRYAQSFLMSPFFVARVNQGAAGVKMPRVNNAEANDTCFPIPPLSIQKAIVAKIDSLLPLVDEYDNANEDLKALNETLPDKLRKSVLQEAIHGNLVSNDIPEGEATASVLLQQILKERQKRENKEKGKKAKTLSLSTIEEEPWELPGGWCWARLGDVMTFVNGRAYKKEELLSAGKYKVLRVGNFFTNDSWYYSDLELPEEKYCFNGDLLYAWSASFGPRIWEGDKTIFHYHIWNVKFDENSLYKQYLYWFFEADKHVIKESTTGSTMVHVSMENMMPRLIPIPPLSVQHRIVEKIEEVFSAINEL